MSYRFLWIPMLLALTAEETVAQQGGPRIPDGDAVGVTVDRFRVLGDEDHYTTVTLHMTQLHAGGLSPDFAVGLFPTLLQVAITTTIDAGIGYNISLPRVTLLPHAGASSLFELGPEGSAGVLGYHFGVSVLINLSQSSAFRLDITRREYFRQNDRPGSSLSLGIGISSVQPRKRGGTP